MHPFAFGLEELDHLRRSDSRMAVLIDECEERGFRPQRPVDENAFNCLIHAINDQLISLRAAATIWAHLTERYGDPVMPAALAAATVDEIKSCGTTLKKAEYMHDIACRVVSGELDLEALRGCSDDEVLRSLTSLRGIGRWTAEMLLIHCYERPDVVSYGDAAIRRGLATLHGLEPADMTPELFDRLTAPYHPFATTASIYLWWYSKQ